MNKEEVRQTPVLDVYLSDFGLAEKDLENKRVLDLGAGQRQFAFDCEATGLGQVWSIADVRWDWLGVLRMMEYASRMKKESEEIGIWKRVGERSLEGLMQKLPFADRSFDMVLSRDAINHVFSDPAMMGAAFGEMIRVLARGRMAYVFPGWLENWTDEEKERVLKALEKVREIKGVMIEEIKRERVIMGMKVSGVMLVIRKL